MMNPRSQTSKMRGVNSRSDVMNAEGLPFFAFVLPPVSSDGPSVVTVTAVSPSVVWAVSPSVVWAVSPLVVWAVSPLVVWAVSPLVVPAVSPMVVWAVSPMVVSAVSPMVVSAVSPMVVSAGTVDSMQCAVGKVTFCKKKFMK